MLRTRKARPAYRWGATTLPSRRGLVWLAVALRTFRAVMMAVLSVLAALL